MKITKAEKKKINENWFGYNWHFETEEKKEIIVPQEIIDDIINDYLNRYTYQGR